VRKPTGVGAAVLSRSEAATIRGESYMRKAFTSLVFDEPNFEHLVFTVKEHAQGRCPACMIMRGFIVSLSILLVRRDIPYYSYGVGFCNLLVLL